MSGGEWRVLGVVAVAGSLLAGCGGAAAERTEASPRTTAATDVLAAHGSHRDTAGHEGGGAVVAQQYRAAGDRGPEADRATGRGARAATVARAPGAAAEAQAMDAGAPHQAPEAGTPGATPDTRADTSPSLHIVAFGPHAADEDAVDAWVAERVRRARAGGREWVRVPLVFASDGWGCTCPTNYVGSDPMSNGGHANWVRVQAANGVQFPVAPFDVIEDGTHISRGMVVRVDGYFTGETVVEDDHDRGDPDSTDGIYRLSVLHVTHVDRTIPDERAQHFRLALLAPDDADHAPHSDWACGRSDHRRVAEGRPGAVESLVVRALERKEAWVAVVLSALTAAVVPMRPASAQQRSHPHESHHARSEPHEAGPPVPLELERADDQTRFTLVPQTVDGGFDAHALDVAAQAFQSRIDGSTHPIAPRLLDLVYRTARHFHRTRVELVSGYRPDRWGSRHTHGRAIDMRIPGVPIRRLAAYARTLGFVGVGLYPRSHFVHLDVRAQSYFWVDWSRPGHRNRPHRMLASYGFREDAKARAHGVLPTPDVGPQPPPEPTMLVTTAPAAAP